MSRPRIAVVGSAKLSAALSTTKVGTQKSFLTRAGFEQEWSARAT